MNKKINESKSWCVVVGFAVPVIVISSVWYWSRNRQWLGSVSNGIFYIASVLLAVSFVCFSRFREKLNHVAQDEFQIFSSFLGSEKKQIGTIFNFKNFDSNDLAAYKKMCLWGDLCLTAFFSLCGWLLIINIFDFFVPY